MPEEIKDPEAVLEALRKANAEAKQYREQFEAAQTEIESYKNFRGKAKNSAIARELRAAGIKNPDRIAKLLDADKIDLDEDGNLKNLDEQLEVVKTDWPELFDAKRRAGNVDQFASGEPDKKLSASELQAQLLNG